MMLKALERAGGTTRAEAQEGPGKLWLLPAVGAITVFGTLIAAASGRTSWKAVLGATCVTFAVGLIPSGIALRGLSMNQIIESEPDATGSASLWTQMSHLFDAHPSSKFSVYRYAPPGGGCELEPLREYDQRVQHTRLFCEWLPLRQALIKAADNGYGIYVRSVTDVYERVTFISEEHNLVLTEREGIQDEWDEDSTLIFVLVH